jgi:hypothetical protein
MLSAPGRQPAVAGISTTVDAARLRRHSAQVAGMCLFVVAVGHTLVSPQADTTLWSAAVPRSLVSPVPGGTFVPARRRSRRRHHF